MNSALLFSSISKIIRNTRCNFRTTSLALQQTIIDPPEELLLEENNYRPRVSETLEQKKARLLYQSRKRGMLENDIILSTFADTYLNKFNEQQIEEYDKVINLPSNDWDLFNWAIGSKPTPAQFENSVMALLKDHARNRLKKDKNFDMPKLQAV